MNCSHNFGATLINPRVGIDNSIFDKDCLHILSPSSMTILGGVTRRGRYGIYSDDANLNMYGWTALDSKDYGMYHNNIRDAILSGIHLERVPTGKSDLLSGAAGAAALVIGGAHTDNLFAYDWTTEGLRRMTYALAVYPSATQPIVVRAA